jgi:hypothetical protein
LVATALLFNVIDWAINLLPGNIVGGQFALSLLAVIVVGTLVTVKKRKGKSRYRGLPPEAITGEQPQTEQVPREPPYS